ncbi:carotenoid-cleaving dioxygenase, mitochondrial-like [Tubulanus polymorphus]|uniref:carotenoid-cleaving dioxygenase, mitochondrial-like n=1 Tax=Tubulanus polymorphus TaxID=672921 RepID=UPI003DA4BCBF
MIHHFKIKNGVVTYRNRFVQSDAYKKNMAANRIVVSEFGTLAFPDPCKNAFQRFFARFTQSDEKTDNTSVNIYPVGDEFYAASETNFIRKIDLETLDSPAKVNLTDIAVLHTATAHPHIESDGTVHNIGMSRSSSNTSYTVVKIPPSGGEGEEGSTTFSKATVVATIPVSQKLYPKYMHSFGMSENYYVLTEQPLAFNVMKAATRKLFNLPSSSLLRWHRNTYTRFRVIDRRTGAEIDSVRYVTDKLFAFHHVNVYEEDDHLVVDLCGYDEGNIFLNLEMERKRVDMGTCTRPKARRYVLPLKMVENGKNLVSLPNSKATAIREGSDIILTYELLTDEETFLEFPVINYKLCSGRKYRYLYGLALGEDQVRNKIVKVDCETREIKSWYDEKKFPSEMVFVQRPGATDEDDGVLLSSVLDWSNLENTRGYLLVLDARTLEELGRACFDFHLGRDFHGMFKHDC